MVDYKNDSNSGLKLCDYVTLNFKNTTSPTTGDPPVVTNGIFTFDIPNSAYYSDRRSQVSTVEISSGILSSSDVTDIDLVVSYENGGLNHYTSGNVRPVIGVWSTYKGLENTGELLINARPQQISLKITKVNRTPTNGSFTGSITLKFKYYNSIQSTAQLHSEYTPIISL